MTIFTDDEINFNATHNSVETWTNAQLMQRIKKKSLTKK